MTSCLLACTLLLIASQYLVSDAGKTYTGYTLFHLFPDTEEKLGFLNAVFNGSYDFEVDFWQPPAKLNEEIEVFVSPRLKDRFVKELDANDVFYNQTMPNIHLAMQEEQKPTTISKKRTFKDSTTFILSRYNPWSDIENYLKKSANMLRDVAKLQSIGRSHEGRDLWVIKLGNPKPSAPLAKKPAIWIDSGIHAREWISPATILYMIDTLSRASESNDTKRQRYLDEIDWYFLPVMNPDGYAYTHGKDRMWRKNRSPQACVGRRCCQGVDLNRNFGTQWGMTGASKNPCSNTYMGAKAFSEPESKAVRDFIMRRNGDFKGFFTFHSFGQLWMYPYGYKKRTYTEDMEDLRDLSSAAVNAIRAVHGTRYKYGTAANILYAASGASEDWAKAEAKIKYSYCVELRPAGMGNGFVLAPRHIVPTGEETWAAMRVVADKIIEQFGVATMTQPSEPDQTTVPGAVPVPEPIPGVAPAPVPVAAPVPAPPSPATGAVSAPMLPAPAPFPSSQSALPPVPPPEFAPRPPPGDSATNIFRTGHNETSSQKESEDEVDSSIDFVV